MGGYIYYSYQKTHDAIMAHADEKLRAAALGVRDILGPYFHDGIIDKSHISHQEYSQITRRLSDFSKGIGVQYIYSMILRNNKVYFTSSSYTDADIAEDKMTYFFDYYPEATEANKAAFRSISPVYEESVDPWGHFRSILYPMVSQDGTVYLAGADILISDLNNQLNTAIHDALITGCFFFFLLVLTGLIYRHTMRRNLIIDASTGFQNYLALSEQLEHDREIHHQVAVIIVNDLEQISSFYGIQVANELMAALMQKISLSMFGYRLYRLNSNSIAIRRTSKLPDHELGDRLKQLDLDQPILRYPCLYASVVIGIAVGSKEIVIENAVIAANQAHAVRDPIITFDQSLHSIKASYIHNLIIARDVREACSKEKIEPYFQPVVDLTNGKILMFESLARIVTPNGTILEPHDFLTVIEKSRLDHLLSRSIFLKTAEYFKDTNYSWSINLTLNDLMDEGFQTLVKNYLATYPNPSRVSFDLCLNQSIESFSQIRQVIQSLRAIGIKFIADDFGSGFSNFSYLIKLGLDGFKLDGNLTKQVCLDNSIRLYISYLLRFAKDTDMIVIAESVEDRKTLSELEKIGIEYAQGFYFGRPASVPNLLSGDEKTQPPPPSHHPIIHQSDQTQSEPWQS